MRERAADLDEAEIRVVAVATGTRAQAAHLQPEYPFPLLVDSERTLYTALGLHRLGLGDWLKPETWRHYVGPLRRGWRRQGRITAPSQLGAALVADSAGNIVFIHRMRGLGDYPSVERVIEVAQASS